MKFLIVVLAVASLCLAEPEADPSFLYAGAYPYAAGYYNPLWLRPAFASGYGYNYPGGYTHVNRLDKREAEADAQVLLAGAPVLPYALPYAAAVSHSAVVPQIRPYGPYNCVTAEGCAVQTLRDHGLVKREADAEADPSLLYAPAYAPAFNPYYAAYNPFVYNPYYYVPRVAPVVAQVNKAVTYTHLGAHPVVNPATVVETTNHVVGHTFVKREAEAEADASVLYAPAYYNAYNAHYNPYFYAPRLAPVVAQVNKPVTYTHLGANPIQPTTVVETTNHVVGHAFV